MLTKNPVRITLYIGAMLIVLLLITLFTFSSFSKVSAANEPNRFQEQLNSWKYSAVLGDDKVLNVVVDYGHQTASDILAFDKSNRDLVNEIQGDIQISVIFQHPLTVDEFKDLVQKSGIKVDTYSARAIDKANVRITIDGSPSIDKKDLVPQASLDKVLEHVQANSPGVIFKGFTSVDGTASKAQVQQLLTDKRVFTVDVSRGIAVQRVRSKLGSSEMIQGIETRLVTPIYWIMEDTGIAPK